MRISVTLRERPWAKQSHTYPSRTSSELLVRMTVSLICVSFIRFHPWSSVVKNLPATAGDTRVMGSIPGSENALEWEMANHASILAWKIPGTVELGRLQSMELQRGRHDWACMHAMSCHTLIMLKNGLFDMVILTMVVLLGNWVVFQCHFYYTWRANNIQVNLFILIKFYGSIETRNIMLSHSNGTGLYTWLVLNLTWKI